MQGGYDFYSGASESLCKLLMLMNFEMTTKRFRKGKTFHNFTTRRKCDAVIMSVVCEIVKNIPH